MKPKDIKGFLVGAITVASSLSVLAAVTIPHTFQAGTLITAKDMNENFSSLKTFSDALEAGKQAKITGSPCATGQFVQGVGADGALTCGVDQIGSSGSAGVSSLNGKTGSLVVQAGTGVTVDSSQAGKIIVNASGASLNLPFSGNANSASTAFSVINAGAGTALLGSSPNAAGDGVSGISLQGAGVRAYSESSYGVSALSNTGLAGVYGESKVSGATGVRGVNSVGPGSSGVWGESALGSGVRGSSTSGNGVLGNSTSGYGVKGSVSGAGTGVYGENPSNSAGAGVQGRADYVNSVGVGGISTAGTGVDGTSSTGVGVRGTSGTGGVGVDGVNVGTYGYGVRGVHQHNGFGVYGNSPNGVGVGGESANSVGVQGKGPIAMSAQGNAVQDAGSGGWAKAMVIVKSDGTIVRCYNGVTGVSSGGCGFSSTRTTQGKYTINFGFDVSNRFYSANGIPEAGNTWSALIYGVSGTTLSVALVSSTPSPEDGSVSVIVY